MRTLKSLNKTNAFNIQNIYFQNLYLFGIKMFQDFTLQYEIILINKSQFIFKCIQNKGEYAFLGHTSILYRFLQQQQQHSEGQKPSLSQLGQKVSSFPT